jgi:hypothetical protein
MLEKEMLSYQRQFSIEKYLRRVLASSSFPGTVPSPAHHHKGISCLEILHQHMPIFLNSPPRTYKDILYSLMSPLQIRQPLPQRRRLLAKLANTLLLLLFLQKLLVRRRRLGFDQFEKILETAS